MLEGVFDALHQPEIDIKAEAFIRKFAKAIFEQEVRRSQSRTPGVRPTPSAFLSCFLDAIPHGLAHDQTDRADKACTVIASIVHDLVVAQAAEHTSA
jgi:transformation/transcription domain-associated protein